MSDLKLVYNNEIEKHHNFLTNTGENKSTGDHSYKCPQHGKQGIILPWMMMMAALTRLVPVAQVQYLWRWWPRWKIAAQCSCTKLKQQICWSMLVIRWWPPCCSVGGIILPNNVQCSWASNADQLWQWWPMLTNKACGLVGKCYQTHHASDCDMAMLTNVNNQCWPKMVTIADHANTDKCNS